MVNATKERKQDNRFMNENDQQDLLMNGFKIE